VRIMEGRGAGDHRRGQDHYRQGGGNDGRLFQGNQGDPQLQEGQRQGTVIQKPLELRERINQVKEKRVVQEKREEDPKKTRCFHCQEMGHHQRECSNNPICYKCKEEGHMAAECVDFHARESDLKMFGFAIPNQGFYNIKIPGIEGSRELLA
jgi:hypothetical protein